MKPGTSARNINEILNASQSHTKRAALSAESTNKTPPLCIGLLATIPTTLPSSSAKPVTSSVAQSGFTSKKESSSTRPTKKLWMSYPALSTLGSTLRVSGVEGALGEYRGGSSRQFIGMNEKYIFA